MVICIIYYSLVKSKHWLIIFSREYLEKSVSDIALLNFILHHRIKVVGSHH